MMEFHPEDFIPAFDLGPRVYESNTLTYQMFGFKGPLWMTQTCNDGSGCPFVQGNPGGSTYEQTNAWLYNSYGVPGQSYDDFVEMMRVDAMRFHAEMGGQRPWEAMSTTNVYMSYNDADPWTGPGVFQQMPADSNLVYDLVRHPSANVNASSYSCCLSHLLPGFRDGGFVAFVGGRWHLSLCRSGRRSASMDQRLGRATRGHIRKRAVKGTASRRRGEVVGPMPGCKTIAFVVSVERSTSRHDM